MVQGARVTYVTLLYLAAFTAADYIHLLFVTRDVQVGYLSEESPGRKKWNRSWKTLWQEIF